MLRSGISGHLPALANVLKRRIKSVAPENKKQNKTKHTHTHTQEVGAVGFD